MTFRLRNTVLPILFATAFATAALTPAAQAQPSKAPIPTTPCTEYARAHAPDGFNWICIGDLATFTEDVARDKQPRVEYVDVTTGKKTTLDDPNATPELPEQDGPSTKARVDDFHAVKTFEHIIWHYSDGTEGATQISINLSLHNHSGDVSIGWWETSGTPIEVQFKLRIREDRPLMPDLDVFEYENPDNYNDGSLHISKSVYEPYWEQGFDALPYPSDPKRYFWDIHDIFVAAEGKGWLSAVGSSQSDRATCDTGLCKFIAGNT
ncbi:hypothetical protein IU510_20720 [Nocardia cyriacigeorgica]|uniref:hypothetical protein n=1 Tax=Nocardia cyriacigeorgica TaxID=135487 RepID=UPI00131A4388|nr:hypothetical protein [Nocardia cyriacigeorgica]MBF6100486.1 hypothetical protein [Nocardia cyriacigeorgica]MBF6320320.1 hypothetical protein [Nocardia cyriacigeorgica]MBF6324766.1 hypothetical protein [Nocardia cyriacigeorgica]MBF6346304.1 hypothetical protein [Nocardia cyriacigeorgica]MBF6534194.1 hypothetical protein [Nocardia cyriacigeorgica]